VRPGNGPHQYRFLPERIQDANGEESSFSEATANDLTPDRQKSGTPSSYKESSCRDKHRRQGKNSGDLSTGESSSNEADAVPANNTSKQTSAPQGTGQDSGSTSKGPPPDFSDLPPEKQDLAEKLSNVGLWAGRIAEVLSRFSVQRIRANFRLYRRRSSEQTIRKPGAWLYKAITDGYALPDSSTGKLVDNGSSAPGSLPPLEHKETVSETEKDQYVAQGTSEDRFHRCLSGQGHPDERRFMYFAPRSGGPTR
jgi:hypothetical protein